MDEAECGKRSALKGARCVWEGARSLDFAYFTKFILRKEEYSFLINQLLPFFSCNNFVF